MRQIYEYHPVIGFRFVPETKIRVQHEGGGYLVRTNEVGFRSDHRFESKKNPDKKRILLFGDSFTAGEGVSNGQRYSDYLEKMMPGVEIFNYGLPATGLDQHYLIYKEYAQAVEHDLLVIAVFVENVRRVGSRFRFFANEVGDPVLYAKPYFVLEGNKPVLHGVPPPKLPLDPTVLSEDERSHIFVTERFPRLKRQYNRLKNHPRFNDIFIRSGFKDQLLKTMGYQPVQEYNDPEHPAWQVMEALIKQWAGEHSKPVVLMPIPIRHYVDGISDPGPYQVRLGGAIQMAGGKFIEPLPHLLEYPASVRKTFYFPNDGHLTKAGHEAFARAVCPYISQALSMSRPL